MLIFTEVNKTTAGKMVWVGLAEKTKNDPSGWIGLMDFKDDAMRMELMRLIEKTLKEYYPTKKG